MSMTEWAENEIAIACARERANDESKEGEWDYGCACYESALKAFKSLCEDGHSGMSISITKNILVRLIEGKPLTPIEDTPEVWNKTHSLDPNKTEYQCKRMSSLFKTVREDGTITYHDTSRYYCVDANNPKVSYTSGLVGRVIDERFPISMPYTPGKPYKVVCEEFLVDPRNGDFDTVGILRVVDPEGIHKWINRFFAEKEGKMTEISSAEYNHRRTKYLNRINNK